MYQHIRNYLVPFGGPGQPHSTRQTLHATSKTVRQAMVCFNTTPRTSKTLAGRREAPAICWISKLKLCCLRALQRLRLGALAETATAAEGAPRRQAEIRLAEAEDPATVAVARAVTKESRAASRDAAERHRASDEWLTCQPAAARSTARLWVRYSGRKMDSGGLPSDLLVARPVAFDRV